MIRQTSYAIPATAYRTSIDAYYLSFGRHMERPVHSFDIRPTRKQCQMTCPKHIQGYHLRGFRFLRC